MANSHEYIVSPRRILIVDDDEDTVRSAALLFETEGHETRTALDGIAALEQGAAFKPHVVSLDIAMPHMDGYAVACAMRATAWGRQALIAAVTGCVIPEGDEPNAFDYLLDKPVDYAKFAHILSDATARFFEIKEELAALQARHASAQATFVRLELELAQRYLDASTISMSPACRERSLGKARRAYVEAAKWIGRGAGVSREDNLDMIERLSALKRRIEAS